ncbi:MAG: DUF1579 domain-containing protein [Planctomycetota bacterium]|nr:DUF1579 domain-containing protein [Planctomycetota bacterium]
MSELAHSQPTNEHLWLKRFVGQWEVESECSMGPDQPPMKGRGVEQVRMLGDLWLIAESSFSMPGAGEGSAVLTLGFDPLRRKFLGTWVGSMMTHLFVYEGELDEATGTLPLSCTGPDFADPTKLAPYLDVYRLAPTGERSLVSHMRGPDGHWVPFMTSSYRRLG